MLDGNGNAPGWNLLDGWLGLGHVDCQLATPEARSHVLDLAIRWQGIRSGELSGDVFAAVSRIIFFNVFPFNFQDVVESADF